MNTLYLKIASTSSILAGILHASIIAFQHMEPIPLETIFFIIFGLIQVVLGFLVLRNSKYLKVLLIINGALAILWILTRTVYTPFMNELEGVNFFDSFVFVIEVLAVFGVLLFYKYKPKDPKEKEGLNDFALLCFTILAGFSVYGSGVLSENLFPNRVIIHSHDSGSHHSDNSHHNDENTDHRLEKVDNSENKEDKFDQKNDSINDHHDNTPHGH